MLVKKALPRQRRRSLRCLIVLALLAVVPLSPALFQDRVLLPADLLMVMQPFRAYARAMGFRRVSNPILDAVQQFWPWRKYAGEQLRHGVIPLWNPYMLAGTPFVANDQSAVFYPETWLFSVMRPERAFAWTAFFYLFASGGFMFFFLRGQGLRRRAAMIGSVAWMYNGFVVGWICLPSFRSVPGWLPLILGAYDRAVRAEGHFARPAWLALAAFGVAMQFLAGNLQISFYLLLALAIFVVWAVAREARLGRAPLPPLGLGLAAVGLGAALAALQLLPTVEFAFRSPRVGMSYEGMLYYRLAWPHLLAGLMPDIFGHPVDYNHWGAAIGGGYRAYTETTWYTGALTAVLAIVAVALRPRRQVWLWVALLAVALGLALGSPLNYMFYLLIPGYGQFRGINRAIVLACFAVCALAALGAQSLLDGNTDALASGGKVRKRATRALLWAVAGALAVGFAGAVWAWIASGAYEAPGIKLGPYTWLQFARFAAIVIFGAGFLAGGVRYRRPVWWALAVSVMAADLGYFARHFFPLVEGKYTRPPSEIVTWLQQQARDAEKAGKPFRIMALGPNALNRFAPNLPMLFGLCDVDGSDSITYGRYSSLFNRYFREHSWTAIPGFFAVRFIVAADGLSSTPAQTLRLRKTWECNLFEAIGASPMAELPAEALVAPHEAAALRATVNLATNPQKPARGVAVVEYGRIQGTGLAARVRKVEADKPVGVAIAASKTSLAVRRRNPNHLLVEPERSGEGVTLQPGSAILVRETYYPGWRAYLDGTPVELIEANWVQMFVPDVAKPSRRLDLVYQPTSFCLGCFVSLAGVAFLMALTVAGLAGRSRSRGGRGSGRR